MDKQQITVSAPGKIHLLGEHVVVYGKPALLTTVNLRVKVTIQPHVILGTNGVRTPESTDPGQARMTNVIEPIVKNHLKIKTIPPYQIAIKSDLPIGSGLGSSAAVSSAYIAALLIFLKQKWDLNLINELTYQAEKVFHGNPSGGDNSTVVFGGLIWFRKETLDLKIIHPLSFSIPQQLAKNFVLINTGKPKETTKEMVEIVRVKREGSRGKFQKIFDEQEQLVKELLLTIHNSNGTELIRIIKAGEKNLEKLGVVSSYVKSIIKKIEKAGGAAKICGAGGKEKATGILLCYHPTPSVINNIAKSFNLDYFKTTLGVEGLKRE